ncbi:hypothetical protein D3C81_1357590 [compost metagenome]
MLRLFSAPVRVKPTAKTISSSAIPLFSWLPVRARATAAHRHSGGSTRLGPTRSISMAMAIPPTTPPNGSIAAIRAVWPRAYPLSRRMVGSQLVRR